MSPVVDREIIDTVRDALIVLDHKLIVVFANQSFYRTFDVRPELTEGRKVYELGNGQWNIANLRALLEDIVPHNTTVEAFEVEHHFPQIGSRVMLLNARKIVHPGNGMEFLLLAIDDITERRELEMERDRLSGRVAASAQEATHRVKNSFQMLLSFVSLQQRRATSDQVRLALAGVAQRISAIARLYQALSQEVVGGLLPVKPYLEALCADLRLSAMEGKSLNLDWSGPELMLDADRVVALGLAVNELVTNSIKHAFGDRTTGRIVVNVRQTNGEVILTVTDDGRGIDIAKRSDSGLGQMFLESFVVRLEGKMTVESTEAGTMATVTLPVVSQSEILRS